MKSSQSSSSSPVSFVDDDVTRGGNGTGPAKTEPSSGFCFVTTAPGGGGGGSGVEGISDANDGGGGGGNGTAFESFLDVTLVSNFAAHGSKLSGCRADAQVASLIGSNSVDLDSTCCSCCLDEEILVFNGDFTDFEYPSISQADALVRIMSDA